MSSVRFRSLAVFTFLWLILAPAFILVAPGLTFRLLVGVLMAVVLVTGWFYLPRLFPDAEDADDAALQVPVGRTGTVIVVNGDTAVIRLDDSADLVTNEFQAMPSDPNTTLQVGENVCILGSAGPVALVFPVEKPDPAAEHGDIDPAG